MNMIFLNSSNNTWKILGILIAGCSIIISSAITETGQIKAQNKSSYVNPFIGTGGHGHTYPGATVPFGMVQLSPDNGQEGWDWSSGYHYSDSVLVGFSHTHLSGTGIGDLADILLMPLSKPADISTKYQNRTDRSYRQYYSHDQEQARPGYYKVVMQPSNIKAELTATKRAGMHRYHFQNNHGRHLLIDLGYAVNWDKSTDTFIEVINDSTVRGYRKSSGWADKQQVFFEARFSQKITDFELANGDQIVSDKQKADGTHVKAQLKFETSKENPLLVKVGISSTDFNGAHRNLTEEITGWNFDKIKSRASKNWENSLDQIEIKTNRKELRETFYTALYHTKLAPIIFSDVDGRYYGADNSIHKAEDYTNYTIFSLWDTFRAEHPLLTLTEGERVNDFVKSMLSFYKEGGYLPVWSLWGNETNTMTGYHGVPVIVDAYLKGFRNYDDELALEAVINSAMQDQRGSKLYRKYGFIPSEKEVESVTKTLEYAFDDWSIAQMAKEMNKDTVYKKFKKRSEYYTNVFDPGTQFFRGKTADGDWVEPFKPLRSSHREDTDYTEGNAWQYRWFVPHNVDHLIELMGGKKAFVTKLDSMFTMESKITGDNASPDISGLVGQYAHGNEPSHHIAYLYNYADAHWKSQKRTRKIMEKMYTNTPDGLAGNEDCGQMSAWYVFSAMGFYPVNPVGGKYLLSSPLFEETTIKLNNGKKFKVIANNVSKENKYIQSAKLNGEPLEKGYILHDQILKGGELKLTMGSKPNKNLFNGN